MRASVFVGTYSSLQISTTDRTHAYISLPVLGGPEVVRVVLNSSSSSSLLGVCRSDWAFAYCPVLCNSARSLFENMIPT